MTDPAFIVDSIHRDVPFRPRSSFGSYQQFTDRSGAVLVAPEISQRLREAARIARPFETGGLLAGRVFRDDHGRYAIVVGYVEAPSDAGRLSSFELTPEATDRLRADASCTHPEADVVGWWHSHGGPSDYSTTDLSQQSIWTQPESVGILVFAEGRQWGAVHQGPDARLLNGAPGVPARPADHTSPSDVSVPDVVGSPAVSRPKDTARAAWHRPTELSLRGFLAGFALVALLAMMASIIILGQVVASQRQLPTQIGRILRSSPRRMWLNWSCISQSLVAGTFVCVANVSDPSDTVEWQLDGRTVSRNEVAIIRLPTTNINGYQIQVLVRENGQTYYGGSGMIY
jgi:hypothetical protein